MQRLLKPFAAAFTFAGAVACGAPSSLAEIPEGALVVDVRTAPEYRSEHFPGAINVPVGEIANRTSELGDKSRTIVVYCRSGHRSAAAKKALDAAGFTNVVDGGGLKGMMRLAPGNP